MEGDVGLFMRMVLYRMLMMERVHENEHNLCSSYIYIDIWIYAIELHSFPVSFISVCIMSVLQLSTKNMFHVVNLQLYTIMRRYHLTVAQLFSFLFLLAHRSE